MKLRPSMLAAVSAVWCALALAASDLGSTTELTPTTATDTWSFEQDDFSTVTGAGDAHSLLLELDAATGAPGADHVDEYTDTVTDDETTVSTMQHVNTGTTATLGDAEVTALVVRDEDGAGAEYWGAGAGRGGLQVRCGRARLPAALWRRRWALARASLVLRLPLRDLRVLHAVPVSRGERARRVRARSVHPLWGAGGEPYDAALLELDEPFHSDETLANHTLAGEHLPSIEQWMEKVYTDYWAHQTNHYKNFRRSSELTLLLTVILPGVLFLVVFMVIISNTAAPIKVPYSNTEDGIITPWMLDKFSAENVKCYPTYGQV